MAEVGREAVGEIDHRGNPARCSEPTPLPGPGTRPQVCGRHIGAGVGADIGRGRGCLEQGEPGGGAAERPRDGDHVPDTGRRPDEGRLGRVAEERHVDDPAPGRCRRVPAHDHHVILGRQRLNAGVEGLGLVDTHSLRAGQRDQRPPGPAAHRGDVGDVDRQRFPSDVGGRGPAAAKVHVLDEQVGGRQEQTPDVGLEDRTVVADSNPDPRRRPGRPPDDLNQAPLSCEVGHPGPLRKFRRSCLPSTVRIDSGWN